MAIGGVGAPEGTTAGALDNALWLNGCELAGAPGAGIACCEAALTFAPAPAFGFAVATGCCCCCCACCEGAALVCVAGAGPGCFLRRLAS